MKKIELTEEQTKECLRLYNEELLGTPSIGFKMGVDKRVINRTLKENGVVLGPSGRKNKGGKKAADKRYYLKNKETISEYYKDWAKENRNHLREYHTEWRNDNKEHVAKKGRDWIQNKRKTDSVFRFKDRIRTAVWQCLKERNISKTNSTFELLGYTLEELMKHLEKQFTEGMTWENYGEWHVDHKIPMAKFNFTSTDDNEFKICWAIENLQPLWGPDNLSKGSR